MEKETLRPMEDQQLQQTWEEGKSIKTGRCVCVRAHVCACVRASECALMFAFICVKLRDKGVKTLTFLRYTFL